LLLRVELLHLLPRRWRRAILPPPPLLLLLVLPFVLLLVDVPAATPRLWTPARLLKLWPQAGGGKAGQHACKSAD
jgi:hypothetical protein